MQIDIRTGETFHGSLHMAKGGVEWRANKKRRGTRISWEDFAQVLDNMAALKKLQNRRNGAQKAWETMRGRFTPEELNGTFSKGARKAAATRKASGAKK